ncbi:23S rRNA (adenine(1618)-N(6))-methyltransferase RlmF [Shewanella sp. A3A]|nr:23S rRNA (adenine(1618)-N(6))-methyltransferase RlmF [Shewanella ferrihydritica]
MVTPAPKRASKPTVKSAKTKVTQSSAERANKRDTAPTAHRVHRNAAKTALKMTTISSVAGLHQRNRHRGSYDFTALVRAEPALKRFVMKNPRGQDTIPFADADAVKLLNKALLAQHYGIRHWDIPAGFLCPPIPGRADYIHRIAEQLYADCPTLQQQLVRMLDIGVGANCIYPIIARVEYGWQVVGSDIDPVSVKSAQTIINANAALKSNIECRLQQQPQHIFSGIIAANERYMLTTCNPPFHSSLAEAQQGTQRKLSNLSKNQHKRGAVAAHDNASANRSAPLNFGGQKAELWCPGGEAAFLKNMAFESAKYAEQVLWFSSLISKSDNVRWLRKQLEKAGAVEARVVEMAQGQKISRFVMWSFLNPAQRQTWVTQ